MTAPPPLNFPSRRYDPLLPGFLPSPITLESATVTRDDPFNWLVACRNRFKTRTPFIRATTPIRHYTLFDIVASSAFLFLSGLHSLRSTITLSNNHKRVQHYSHVPSTAVNRLVPALLRLGFARDGPLCVPSQRSIRRGQRWPTMHVCAPTSSPSSLRDPWTTRRACFLESIQIVQRARIRVFSDHTGERKKPPKGVCIGQVSSVLSVNVDRVGADTFHLCLQTDE